MGLLQKIGSAMMGPLSPVIGMAGGLGSSIVNAISAKRNTDRTIKYNQEMAKYQYDKDVEMWNKANEYNLPSNQMARFKQAGLSPQLVYSQGSSGTTATTLPKYNAPTARYEYKPMVDPASMIATYQDMAVKQAQIDNLKAQKDNTVARTLSETKRPAYFDSLMEKIANDISLSNYFKPYKADLYSANAWASNERGYQSHWDRLSRQLEYNSRLSSDYWRKKADYDVRKFPMELEKYNLQNDILNIEKKSNQWWYDYYNTFTPSATRWFDTVGKGLNSITSLAGGFKNMFKKPPTIYNQKTIYR